MTNNQVNTDCSAGSTDAQPSGQPTSRRGLLKLAAVGLGGVGLAAATGAQPAAAADGGAVILGAINNSSSRTTIETSAAGQLAIRGYSTATTGSGVGVYGDSASNTGIGVKGIGAAVGVTGSSTNGSGVSGASTSGPGVSGTSTDGAGIVGRGGGAGAAGAGDSATSPDLLAAGFGLIRMLANQPAPPLSGTYLAGDLICSNTGSGTWVCVTTGSPGVWRKIAGPATAGALHAISPQRVFDSHHTTKLANGQTDDVVIANAIDSTGAVTVPDLVPDGATAIALNLTITATTGAGHLIVWPQGQPKPLSTAISWFAAGQTLTNGFTVAISTIRHVSVYCSGGSTHFSIDVAGYYL